MAQEAGVQVDPRVDGWKYGHASVGLVRTTPPFVGRRKQLDWFANRLQEVLVGRPCITLIPGEAGLGKTRLLQEVSAEAERHGVLVYFGRSDEGLELPHLPFAHLLTWLLERVPEDVKQSLGDNAARLDRFLEPNRARTEAANAAMSTQGDQDKLQLLLALSHTVIKLAQSSPMLVVVDDLHWADQPCLDSLGYLAFAVADAAVRESIPLMIALTYRPVELESRVAYLIARLQRERICDTLELTGLDESEIYDLLQGVVPARPSHQLIATISEATQGNPLFIQETVHHLKQGNALRERSGFVVTTSPAADLRLPEHVTGAIVSHTQGLSEECRQVLTLAAFLGQRFSFRALGQALGQASGMHEEALLHLLEEGMRQGLLLSEGQDFRFTHSLIQHVLYNEPSVARRQRLHHQIAESLERLYHNCLDDHVLEIAHHLLRAGSLAAGDRIMHYARRAGDRACAVSGWGDAARYYEAALAATEATDYLSIQDRAEFHYRAGYAYQRDLDVGPCLDHYEKSIAAYRLTGDVLGLAQVLMEKIRVHTTLAPVPFGTLVDVQPLEEVLEVLGEDEEALGLRGRIVAAIADAYWHASQTGKADRMTRQALEIGQQIKDERLCAHASYVLALAQMQELRLHESLETYHNALTYARRTDDLRLQSWPLQRMPMPLTWLGRLDEAEARVLEAYELTCKTQDWAGYSLALASLVTAAVIKGDFEVAERHTQETIRMVSRSRYLWGGLIALSGLASAHALRGAWTEAEQALDMLVEPGRIFPEMGAVLQDDIRVFRQLLLAHQDASEPVKAQLAAYLRDAVKEERFDNGSPARYCALIEMSDLIAVPSMVVQPYRILSRVAERGVLFSSRWVFLIPRLLGVAATLRRWWDQAEAHFETAIDVAMRSGARPELGRAYLDYARMLSARGKIGDCHRVLDLTGKAAAIFDELGMEPFIRRAARLTRAMQARLPRTQWGHVTPPDRLIDQEIDVLFDMAQDSTAFLG